MADGIMEEKTKKLPFKYMWWFLFSAYVVYFIVRAAGQMGDYFVVVDTMLKQGIFIGLSLLIMAICGLLAYLAGRVLRHMKPGRLFRTLTELLFWLVTGSLSALRFWEGLPRLTGDLTLLQNALIQTGVSSREVLSDTAALYVDLLSLLFSFLGNKESVIIYIQFVIQIVTMMILYVAVRILCGRIAAYTTVLMIAVSARWIEAASSLQAEVIYMLLWSMMLLFFAFLFRLLATGTGLVGKMQNVFILISGILCGMLIYYDLLGLLLLPLGIYFISLANRLKRPLFLLLKTVVLAGGSVLGWLVLILRETFEKQTALLDSMSRWSSRYKIRLAPTAVIPEEHLLLLAIMIMFALFLSISFWLKERQSASVWIFAMLLLCVAVPSLNSVILDSRMWITLIWAILAGEGLQKTVRAGMTVPAKSPKDTNTAEHSAVIESSGERAGHVPGQTAADNVPTEIVKKQALFEQLKTPDAPDAVIDEPDTVLSKQYSDIPEENNKIPLNLDVDKESVFEKISETDTLPASVVSSDMAEEVKEKNIGKEKNVENAPIVNEKNIKEKKIREKKIKENNIKEKKIREKKIREKKIKEKKTKGENSTPSSNDESNIESKNRVSRNTERRNTESKNTENRYSESRRNGSPAKMTEAAQKAEESRYDTSSNVKYIDNPLPLPPKPVKKGMRYPLKIGDSQMHYDYEVKPDDDYDIE